MNNKTGLGSLSLLYPLLVCIYLIHIFLSSLALSVTTLHCPSLGWMYGEVGTSTSFASSYFQKNTISKFISHSVKIDKINYYHSYKLDINNFYLKSEAL